MQHLFGSGVLAETRHGSFQEALISPIACTDVIRDLALVRRGHSEACSNFAGAQAVLLLLVLYAFTLPLLVAAFVNMLWLAILIDIIAVQSFFALNEVARDLEDPFVYEPNDLPMARLQVIHLDIND